MNNNLIIFFYFNKKIEIEYQILRFNISNLMKLFSNIEIRIYSINIDLLEPLSKEYQLKLLEIDENEIKNINEIQLIILKEIKEENKNIIYLDHRTTLINSSEICKFIDNNYNIYCDVDKKIIIYPKNLDDLIDNYLPIEKSIIKNMIIYID